MKKQLTGFAWIFFGLLLYIAMGDVWLPAVGDSIWPVLSVLCGAVGLVTVIVHSSHGD